MRQKLAELNTEAEKLLPPNERDSSGVGVNYADAFIKPLNTTLDDGVAVTCKRRGLRISMKIGDNQGQALMSLHNDGPDPKVILERALVSAAADAGSQLEIAADGIFIQPIA